MGLRTGAIKMLTQNRDVFLKRWESVGPYPAVKRAGSKTWKKLIQYCVETLSAKIDSVVTTDIHRFIRMPDTLHSKTGLKKTEFPISHLDYFDPLKDAVAFKNGATKIFVSDAPEFRIGDKTFGPYRNQKIELPTAAALLLICRKRAKVME
jgi:DNA primase small subunit